MSLDSKWINMDEWNNLKHRPFTKQIKQKILKPHPVYSSISSQHLILIISYCDYFIVELDISLDLAMGKKVILNLYYCHHNNKQKSIIIQQYNHILSQI